eukprot:scaffold330_cov179-Chaetoceros_neogracile.AAC.3
MSLTPNAIRQMVSIENGGNNNPSFTPKVQVIRVIPITSNPSSKRYRVILSDGIHHCQGMLATQNNHYVETGAIANNVILQVSDYMKNVVQNKTLIILLGFEVLNNPGQSIGSPSSIDNAPAASATTHAPTVPKTEPVRGSNPYGGMSQAPAAPIMRTAGSSSSKPITPIAALNMYQNRWTIKARVTNKSDIRHWSNAKGEGQLFSMEVLDSTMDIRATFFKEAVDKFYNMLEVDKIYCLSGGRLKAANMQYNTCKSSFEITFDQNAEITLESDTGEIKHQSYDLKPISELDSVEPGAHVDILGVVKSVGEPSTIVSKKSGKELQKCELTIGDDSGGEVACTIWGDRAMGAPQEFAGTPVVAFRRARVSDFGGRTLSASGGNGTVVNPKLPEADRLRNWWQSGGNQDAVKKMSTGGMGANRFPEFDQRKNIAAIKGEGMGHSSESKPDYVSFKATVSFIKSDKEGGAWYPACMNPEDPCKNRCKVTQNTDGTFHCDRCNQSNPDCLYRYIFSATISDGSATSWVSFFDDQARILFEGMEANDLQKIYVDEAQGGMEAYQGFFSKAQFTDWVFTCKVKQEFHQDEARVKTSIQSIHPVDYAKEGRSMLNAILAM